MNFEELLTREFGRSYSLRAGLAYSLQFSTSFNPISIKAMSEMMQKQYRNVKAYIDDFRSSLSDDIGKDLKYSFRVFLVPKVNNHPKSADVAIEFVNFDPSRPDEMEKYEHLVTFIKEKQIPVANLGYLKAGDVVRQVNQRSSKRFTHFTHMLCYTYFQVRPKGLSTNPSATNVKYCIYDAVHRDYVYKPEWVDFLCEKLKDGDFISNLRPKAEK